MDVQPWVGYGEVLIGLAGVIYAGLSGRNTAQQREVEWLRAERQRLIDENIALLRSLRNGAK